ncbi:MAG: TIGR00375 family protein [Candidatus Eremiobacteraeota bacterium]|nr:TIGR00375 family protein [Candidatus Eremiobacteraeota bacterium]
MQPYYVDLHVHIGQNGRGKAVKITASRKLTFEAVIRECLERKGIDVVGIIDCACTGVLEDLRKLIDRGELMELPEGGLRHRDRVTVIAGAEVEAVEDDGGVSHHLCYFPYLRNLAEFSRVMTRYITNMELSSQRCGLPARELHAVVQNTGGVLIPAHAFTPHKSVYGNACDRLQELFGEGFSELAGLELGLSSDINLADRIQELEGLTFLSNSDAHSLGRIGREYNLIKMEAPNFRELMLALRREGGRSVVANYGMNPNLGRYHRSFCHHCELPMTGPAPVLECPHCGQSRREFVRGVVDRVTQIADYAEPHHPEHRPPYHYQVPLSFVPGLGSRGLNLLIRHLGSEMAVLHEASRARLAALVGWQLADKILAARQGRLDFSAGGGGHYGKVIEAETESAEQLALF